MEKVRRLVPALPLARFVILCNYLHLSVFPSLKLEVVTCKLGVENKHITLKVWGKHIHSLVLNSARLEGSRAPRTAREALRADHFVRQMSALAVAPCSTSLVSRKTYAWFGLAADR